MLTTKLIEVFADNFLAYYRAHAQHFNITGRNFAADHKLLGEIYEDLQEQIDPLGEFIRTIGAEAPETIQEILSASELGEEVAYSADDRLQIVLSALEYLVDDYKELFDIATAATDQDIANFAADRIGSHSKQIWQLRSTLE